MVIKDTVFQTRPDVQIGYIGQYDLPADTVTALQDALTPYCTDLNGDGKVVVQVNSYTVDFNAENDNTDAYNQMAGVTRLSADLSDSGTLYVCSSRIRRASRNPPAHWPTWTAPQARG